jgi:hypothetical protein
MIHLMICTAKISGQIDLSANYVSVGNCLLRVYADCSMSSMSGVADERESARLSLDYAAAEVISMP